MAFTKIRKIKYQEMPRQKLERVEIKDRGRVVSNCLLFSGDKMSIIYNLFTNENCRGQGYATKCVSAAKHRFENSNMAILMAGTVENREEVRKVFNRNDFKEIICPTGDVIMYYVKG